MKQKYILMISVFMILALSACSKQKQNLEDMTSGQGDGYVTIVWGDKTYVPYCAISNSECGKQIGIVDGDDHDRVYEYKGYSTDEWLISIVVSGLMDSAMLMREINVTDIPDDLQSEYEWNNLSTESASDYPAAIMADEHTITFTGTIVDHTITPKAPTICVKPSEDVIPYDAVFFVLPDDEAEWDSQTGAVVIITCADTFTEQEVPFGSLISIKGWKSEKGDNSN